MSLVCARTGYAYVEGPIVGYRIAKPVHGPANPQDRRGGSRIQSPIPHPMASRFPGMTVSVRSVDRSQWSRFDAPGKTIYLAEDRWTAYAETLSVGSVRREHRSAISKAAQQFGISYDDALQLINDDFDAHGWPRPGRLPDRWRTDRKMYRLRVEETRRWVDVSAPETIAALNGQLKDVVATDPSLTHIDQGAILGTDREVTTYLAEWIKNQRLDDGSFPAGVMSPSKYGSKRCWAHWLDHPGPGPLVTELAAETIEATDPDLQRVLSSYGLSI